MSRLTPNVDAGNDLRERLPRFEFLIQVVRILSLPRRGSYWYFCQCSRLPPVPRATRTSDPVLVDSM